MTKPDTTKLNKLKAQRNRLTLDIDWANFALSAPNQYINEDLQELRKKRLANMLQELAILTKLIVSAEFEIFEQKTLAEREQTKAVLAEMRLPFTEQNGNLFINL